MKPLMPFWRRPFWLHVHAVQHRLYVWGFIEVIDDEREVTGTRERWSWPVGTHRRRKAWVERLLEQPLTWRQYWSSINGRGIRG